MLLSRLPLPLRGARLACVRPAASVHSEPGSNSSLKCFDSSLATFVNALSADFVPGQLLNLLAFACFLLNRWTLLRTSARWTTIHPPDARTSHLRTLSKIFRNRPQRLVPSRHRSARGSRTLYSSFRERQHLSANFLLLPDSPKSLVSEAFHLTGPRILQHVFDSSTLVETAAFYASHSPTNRSAGRASYSNVSDRQHLPKPLLLRVPDNHQPVSGAAHYADLNGGWEGVS